MSAKFVRILTAILVALGAGLPAASPASAVSYRDLKSVQYNSCVYAYGDPLEDIYAKSCSTTPAANGNWSVTNVGSHNNHSLWVLTRQGGKCLGIGGTASNNYLYSSCTVTGSKNVWEVFPTTYGVDPVRKSYVLKSFGAYQSWGQHKCLTFSGAKGGNRPQLGACSTSSKTDMIFR
ncbi:hypothetical protein [Actinoplanes regularis]|uniref:hypothetical protein n=1 Tax=Actinoplanes regularis TaxID=52697 RepID=UPI0024A36B2D|nr:hypothetical protein [Actinoplanes regularis]GLW27237.1 hypothetical protein Areg01_01780 [Actinoplanes regularis]